MAPPSEAKVKVERRIRAAATPSAQAVAASLENLPRAAARNAKFFVTRRLRG